VIALADINEELVIYRGDLYNMKWFSRVVIHGHSLRYVWELILHPYTNAAYVAAIFVAEPALLVFDKTKLEAPYKTITHPNLNRFTTMVLNEVSKVQYTNF